MRVGTFAATGGPPFVGELEGELVHQLAAPDMLAANNDDPILKLVPVARRATQIARRHGKNTLEWNVFLQGKNETVFFDF